MQGASLPLAVLLGAMGALAGYGWSTMLRMPGNSYAGALPTLTEAERRVAGALREDVRRLTEFGHRSVADLANQHRAAAWIEVSLQRAGYTVERHAFRLGEDEYYNLIAERRGAARAQEIVVVGAHYDTVGDGGGFGTVGANDNASGVAATLAMARAFADARPARTVRFVAFSNEEPPSFQSDAMGSRRYARRCRERGENVVAMVSLETIGYYDDAPGSQAYPPPLSWFYPDTGNFIGFVSNLRSAGLLRELLAAFRRTTAFPSEGAALPAFVPGVDWSDHWSFWQEGYPALMVTDTAPYRYPHYHSAQDTPEKLDYERMARVVVGLQRALGEFVGGR